MMMKDGWESDREDDGTDDGWVGVEGVMGVMMTLSMVGWGWGLWRCYWLPDRSQGLSDGDDSSSNDGKVGRSKNVIDE